MLEVRRPAEGGRAGRGLACWRSGALTLWQITVLGPCGVVLFCMHIDFSQKVASEKVFIILLHNSLLFLKICVYAFKKNAWKDVQQHI